MIKKFLFILIILISFQTHVNAVENKNVLNLKTGNSYIIPIDARPMNIKITNTDIVKADSITGIDEKESSLLITTLKEGISYITFNLNKQEITLRLLIDNLADEDKNILKLDVLNEYKQK